MSLQESMDAYRSEVTSRMGMVPNFFAPVPDAPDVVRSLWEFAKSTYLENPIPSPLKDRIFIYLSRFCEVRYCVARHCAFLLMGDPREGNRAVTAVMELLRTAPPWDRDFQEVLAGLQTLEASDSWPNAETRGEELLIAAAASVFVDPRRSDVAREALRKALGAARFEHLMVFLTFIRTAHYWTLVHPELAFEEDVKHLLDANDELAKLLLVDKEAGRLDMGVRLFEELTDLRALHEKRDLENAKLALEAELREKETLLSELRTIEQEVVLKDERLQMALSASGVVGLWDWMVGTNLLHGDANFARLYGLGEAETVGGLTMAQYQRFVVPEDIQSLRDAIDGVFERGEAFNIEYRVAVPGLPLRWIECVGRMNMGPDGKPFRFSGTAVDVTGRRQGEQQKQLLMDELAHRVKNTFAMVQAIVGQTLKDSDQQVSKRLQQRLTALSHTHEVLLQSSWTSTPMGDLATKVLGLESEGDRFELSGPEVEIGPEAALSLSLLLHELATNASKYGALSVEQGRVIVAWSVENGVFRLSWKEAGGPPATEPKRRGFGSRLIGMGICGARNAELDYAGHGFSAAFTAPVERVLAAG